ncbi:YueI family protein [Enterococcus saccharolyticus]|uniref:YueI family protein n=1 Tax=Enterococcus saccharolyticus TaxID=41997 RepID=UPI001E4CA924|nr:YueI family protein [Enterococcus saccharolyticus]MCD5002191.1 YueI family protein [Enterococcus saccharolyticus]
MSDELQKHLDKSLYGAPLVKPDEQRKYLGTFRERCYLSMTIAQMKKPSNKKLLAKHVADYSNSSILLNGQLPENVQTSYIQLATQTGIPFTIIDQATASPDSIGLLVVAKTAVNEQTIDIEEKFAPSAPSPSSDTQEKKSFWHKLFH